MQTSASDLVEVLASVERLSVSKLTDDEKVMVLEDIKRCFPPSQFTVNCMQTREIVLKTIEEAINGLQAKEAESQKPKQGRPRKTPPKSAKK